MPVCLCVCLCVCVCVLWPIHDATPRFVGCANRGSKEGGREASSAIIWLEGDFVTDAGCQNARASTASVFMDIMEIARCTGGDFFRTEAQIE